MFIKRTALKKMFKAAFNGKGLYIETDKEGYRFKGSYWDLWVRRDMLPKEIKADIVELIGDVPQEGFGGSYTKEGCQQEVPGFECSREMAKEEGDIYIDTGMIIMNNRRETLRVMQNPETLKILLPYNHIMEAIHPEDIDHAAGETDVYGAFNPKDNILLFNTNVSAFMTFARGTNGMEGFAEEMRQHDLYELIHPEIPQ